jgi:hypothetical protein
VATKRTEGDAGFVQIVALAGLATVGSIVTVVMLTSSASSTGARALDRLVRADAQTTSGWLRLYAALRDPYDDIENSALNATNGSLKVGKVEVLLRMESEASKLDVGLADIAVLSRYLDNAGIRNAGAEQVLDSVVAARQVGNVDAALTALQVVLLGNLDPYTLGRDLTIYSPHAGVDPTFASLAVLAALPDLTPVEASAIDQASYQERQSLGIQSNYFAPSGRTYALVAGGGSGDSPERRLIVELSASGRPILVAMPAN